MGVSKETSKVLVIYLILKNNHFPLMVIFKGIIIITMSRDYKKFSPECFYHIYNRGVNKMNIFIDEQDKKVFLSRLKENLFPELGMNLGKINKLNSTKIHTPYVRKVLPANSFSLVAYCIMPNHFHFLIKQNKEISISKLVGKITTSYSKYFNLKYKRVGAIFQDQFKAIHVDDNTYLLWLSEYIHLNPVVAGLVKFAENWKWSSYQEFLNKNKDNLCEKSIILDQFKNIESYKQATIDFLKSIQTKKFSEIEMTYAEFESP